MQSSMQLNQGSNQPYKPSKTSLNNNFEHIDPKNTHTLNKSNQFYISKTSQDSLVSIHVNLVMAKSHCTSTCIKSSKEYCVLCVKNIARVHKCIHVMTI